MGRFQKYWVGLVFLGIGIVLLAAELNWLPVEVKTIWPFVWPVFVIIAGGSWLLGQLGGRFSWFPVTLAGMVTAYGVIELLDRLGLTSFDAVDVFARGWPLFILAIGLEMLFGGSGRRRVHVVRKCPPDSDKGEGGSRTYTGRVIRENGSWNVRWEDVGGKDTARPDDGAANAGDSDGDGVEAEPVRDDPVEAEWVDTGADADGGGDEADAKARTKSARPGRATGFRNQTRVAGEVRIGNRPWELDPDTVFNLGAGEVELDLSTAHINPGENHLTIRLWAGQVTVYVPAGLAIAVDSNLTAGQISIFGDDHDGLGPAVGYRSDDYEEADRKVSIRVEMMFGQVNVKEAR